MRVIFMCSMNLMWLVVSGGASNFPMGADSSNQGGG